MGEAKRRGTKQDRIEQAEEQADWDAIATVRQIEEDFAANPRQDKKRRNLLMAVLMSAIATTESNR